MSTFKASAFRSTSGQQYADKLWLNSLGAIATPGTDGYTDSVRAAFLSDADNASPDIFGSLSWKAATEDSPSKCEIKLYDGFDVVPALTIDPFECRITSALKVDGTLFLPSVQHVPSTGNFLAVDPFSGEVLMVPITGAAESIDTIPYLTVTEEFRLENLSTFQEAPYLLCLEPITGVVFKAETPYQVTTNADGAIDLVTFRSNVFAETTVHVQNSLKIGSEAEDNVWRLKPDAASGGLAIQKWEAGEWVTKSLISPL